VVYTCAFEGAENNYTLSNNKDEKDHPLRKNVTTSQKRRRALTLKKGQVRGAIRTDFVLSAEIIVIAPWYGGDQGPKI